MKWDTEKTNQLIKLSKAGDAKAKEALVKENEPLVKSIVKRFLGRGADFDDLFQVGNIGLLKAISGFDEKFGVRFSTYAVPMIIGEVKRYIRDDNTVKMPRSLKELQQKIRFCRQKLSIQNGREPGIMEIAHELGCAEEDIILALESMNGCASLDEPCYDDASTSKMDTLECETQKMPIWDKLALRQCLDQLDTRERQVILLRYYRDMTQTKVAQMFGISQVQVSRIESRAMEKLRRKLK